MYNMMVVYVKIIELYKSMNLKGEIGIVYIFEGKCLIIDLEEDKRVVYLDDILVNKFMFDVCFKGEYLEEILEIVNIILFKNNGSFIIYDGDLNVIKSVVSKIDFLGMNYYFSYFLKVYEGESKIYYNGIGEKGISIFVFKGIGVCVSNLEVEIIDWDWLIYL